MTVQQFRLALDMSETRQYDHHADINVFDGFALREFQPVYGKRLFQIIGETRLLAKPD